MSISLDGLNAQMVGDVGQRSVADGSVNQKVRLDRQTSLLVSGLHGKYTEQALRGNIFSVANQAVVALSAALSTTYTGLCIGNPTNSSVNMSLIEVGWAFGIKQNQSCVLGVMTTTMISTDTAAQAIAPRNALVGGRKSVMLADDAATINTPVLERVVGSHLENTLVTNGPYIYSFDGTLIVPPGGLVAFYASAAVEAGCIIHFVWEEIPV